jgi:4-hydroxythreonine-4-phosphate dehydrogenase
MGDPAGVGPELCLRLLERPVPRGRGVPVVFGDVGVLRRVAKRLGRPFRAPVIALRDWPDADRMLSEPFVVDLRQIAARSVRPGRVAAACGEAAYRYVIAAIDAARAGEVAAVATGPLNKEALHAAGHLYPGHTEIFAERLAAARWCMMLTARDITCSLVTTHAGYAEVPALLTRGRILEVIQLTAEGMRRLRRRKPRLAVCALNPHAGEHGLFGRREEERLIAPAVEAARRSGVTVEGPLPPDTAFTLARRRVTDAYVCMYHDQALIPLKALAFDRAVNVTLGLSIVRTSVDHGTAYDIAWQGKADPGSLLEAVRLADRLSAAPNAAPTTDRE